MLVVYGGLLLLTYWGFMHTPKGFIPTQDMGYLLVNVQLPDAASAERTREVTDRVQKICLSTPGVKHTVAVAGQSFVLSANASNFGSMFVILDDFAKREEPGLSADEIAAKLRTQLRGRGPRGDGHRLAGAAGPRRRPDRRIQAHGRRPRRRRPDDPARADRQPGAKQAGSRRTPAANGPPLIIAPNVFRANAPQLYVDMNRAQCMTMGVPLADAFNTLQIYLGSLYVNDFNLFGRTWQVIVQADAQFRNQVEKVAQLKVRNNAGRAWCPSGAWPTCAKSTGR